MQVELNQVKLSRLMMGNRVRVSRKVRVEKENRNEIENKKDTWLAKNDGRFSKLHENLRFMPSHFQPYSIIVFVAVSA